MADINVVFHFVFVVSVPTWINDPERKVIYADTTLGILETALREDIHVVVASNAAVHGYLDTEAVSEDASMMPTSLCGFLKLTADEYVRLYADLYDHPAIALRYFNVYGTQ